MMSLLNKVSLKDKACVVFFILIWICPLIYTNLTIKFVPFLPSFITQMHSTALLFTHANWLWPMPYIQVLPQGASQWITLPEEDYFSMRTFGNRTRLFEALYYATIFPDAEKRTAGVQREMAEWIARRYEGRGGQKVSSVRFIAGIYDTTKGDIPEGAWRTLPIEEVPVESMYVISTHDLKGGY